MTDSTIATLWRYPVKSMMGEELNASEITINGVLGDRVFACIDNENGNVVSAKNPKKWPDFFAYRAAFCEAPQAGSLPPVWITLADGTVVRSDDANINEVLSAALARSVSLKNLAPEKPNLEQYWPEYEGDSNEISNEAIAGDAPSGTFFDYAALHIITTSSIEKLQSLYPEGRFEMRRFRPNIVVDTQGQSGFVENDWVGKTIRIGDVRLQITDPCPRCVMPTLAQGDLPNDPAIFKNGIMHNKVLVPFAGKALPSIGVYAKVLTPGVIRRGAEIIIE
ncbi:MOSC domain-containing protein [Methylosoma difficile]